MLDIFKNLFPELWFYSGESNPDDVWVAHGPTAPQTWGSLADTGKLLELCLVKQQVIKRERDLERRYPGLHFYQLQGGPDATIGVWVAGRDGADEIDTGLRFREETHEASLLFHLGLKAAAYHNSPGTFFCPYCWKAHKYADGFWDGWHWRVKDSALCVETDKEKGL